MLSLMAGECERDCEWRRVLCRGRKIDEKRKAVGLRLLCFEKVAVASGQRALEARARLLSRKVP